MNIADKIRQQRRLAKLNQEELAGLIGVSLKTVQRWEYGERSPRLKDMQKLSEVLNVPIDEFLDDNVMELTDIQPKTDILFENNTKESSSPTMAYWGGVLDNAQKAVKDGQNLRLIYSLLADATSAVKAAMA